MTEKQDIASRESTEAQSQEQRPPTVLSPPVDIFEDAEGITLEADMPGVSKDRLNMQVNRGELLVEGNAHIEMPGGYASAVCRRALDTLPPQLRSEQ